MVLVEQSASKKLLPKTPLADSFELMSTPRERARGLLKYQQAPLKHAAVFRLPLQGFFPLVHTFGMKFSIDIVYLDANKKILGIYKNISPGRLIIPWKFFFGGCQYLVEFCVCDLKDLQAGDVLTWCSGDFET